MNKIGKGVDATSPPKVLSLTSVPFETPKNHSSSLSILAVLLADPQNTAGPLTQLTSASERWQVADLGTRAQVGNDVEQGLGSMASLQAVSEEEWHEEVANLSPKELVEATFQRLFPGTFLYALPIWKHKVVLLHLHALHPACFKVSVMSVWPNLHSHEQPLLL